VVSIPDLSWQEFELALAELGDKRLTRIAYCQGNLEIMAPLPDHERAKILLADLVKLMLRWQGRHWEPLGSTTFKRQGDAGNEPDECFYSQNQPAMLGKDRIDLAVDPPPDLAIESDFTSKTRIDGYLAIRVPELWIYAAGVLRINLLQGDCYVASSTSPTFPEVDVVECIPRTIERAKQIGTSQALLEFEHWLTTL
jgi:Uma2 family endonuclease